jgi:hypothetical protein
MFGLARRDHQKKHHPGCRMVFSLPIHVPRQAFFFSAGLAAALPK